MSFERSIKPAENEICPICRKGLGKHEKRVLPPAYRGNSIMCMECVKRLYKSSLKGRRLGYIDDSTNLFVRFLPAPILERPLFFRRNFPTGYEYRMPEFSGMRLVIRSIVWALVMLIIFAAYMLCSPYFFVNVSESCHLCVYGIFIIGSTVCLIADFSVLVKGLFLGMGHLRRVILLMSMTLFAAVLFFSAKQLI